MDRTTFPRQVLFCRIALFMTLAAFAIGIIRLAAHAQAAFTFPYTEDYGEGVVWQQMRDMVAGIAYQPISLDRAVAYQYPPLYHLVTAMTASLFRLDELYAGRLVSLICIVLSAILIGRLTFRSSNGLPSQAKIPAAIFAGLAFLTLPLFNDWALMMRIDALACLLTVAGMLLASRAPRSLAAALAAGLVFTAAMYSRQTSVFAPAAAFVVLMIVCPKRAWLMAGTSMLSGLIALAWLEHITHSGFLLNIVSYNVNRFVWRQAPDALAAILANFVPIAIAASGAAYYFRRINPIHRSSIRPWVANNVPLSIAMLMLVFKTLGLPMMMKSGASDNYLIDWFIGISIFFGFAAVPFLEIARGQAGKPSLWITLLFTVGMPVCMSVAEIFPDHRAQDEKRRGMDEIISKIAASNRPVLTDDAALLIRAGKREQWEMGMIAEMGALGRFDEKSFADKIRRGEFGFMVTQGDQGDPLFDERFNPVMADAIHAAFPRREIIGGRVVHLPAYDPAITQPNATAR